MSSPCPAIVIAGTASGVGKTSLSLGITAALVRRGLKVQTFKVGPDFLDPSYLAMASGRPCYNLDGWMTGRDYVRQLFSRATAQADVAIIEGVMGLFDGASPATLEGSTAEIALWLDAPVLLVVNAHGAARSLAATVKGFAEFEPGLRIAGVIANQSGSERHKTWLDESLRAAHLPSLVGAVPRGSLPLLQSRHLGLVTADQRRLSHEVLAHLGDACERCVYLDGLLSRAGACVCRAGAPSRLKPDPQTDGVSHADVALLGATGGLSARARWGEHTGSKLPVAPARPEPELQTRVRIGIARDEAFHFYYLDNLEALQAVGAELVEFSPLHDAALPVGLNVLYIGGGYPEEHASQLAANRAMLEEIRRFAASGRAVYAECGGLMYLGRSVQSPDGQQHALAGVLPIDTALLDKLQSLGYIEATPTADSLWGAAGQTLRGHEFHYSRIVADDSPGAGWHKPYAIRRRRCDGSEPEGFAKGRILASYVHLHWASRPQAVARFLDSCEAGHE